MSERLVVSPSPHVHGKNSTSRNMLDVVIALLPARVVSVWVFVVNVLAVTAVAVGCGVLFGYMIQK